MYAKGWMADTTANGRQCGNGLAYLDTALPHEANLVVLAARVRVGESEAGHRFIPTIEGRDIFSCAAPGPIAVGAAFSEERIVYLSVRALLKCQG